MMLAAALAAGLAQAGAAQPAQEIRALDAEEASAMLAADLAALDRIWAPDSAVNAPDNAVREKSQVLAAVRDGRIRYSGFERTVERVDVRGDVAISMGGEVVVPKGDRPDAGQPLTRRYTHVWLRSGGRWALVGRHANVVPPASA
jgi:ketosteroid isomerase-like protein